MFLQFSVQLDHADEFGYTLHCCVNLSLAAPEGHVALNLAPVADEAIAQHDSATTCGLSRCLVASPVGVGEHSKLFHFVPRMESSLEETSSNIEEHGWCQRVIRYKILSFFALADDTSQAAVVVLYFAIGTPNTSHPLG